ncbi:MAG: hypothetical protein JW829_00465 [Pirellulales bacterium]|nr:hypothetical protein [Pirellulales bacterium]
MKLQSTSRVVCALGLSVLWASPVLAIGRLPGGILQTLGWGYGPGYHAPKTPGTSWFPQCGPSSHLPNSSATWSLASPSVLSDPSGDLIWSGITPVWVPPSGGNEVNCADPARGFMRLPPVEPFHVPRSADPSEFHLEKSGLPDASKVPASDADSVPPDPAASPSDRKIQELEPSDPTNRSELHHVPMTEVSRSNQQKKFQYRYPPPHILPRKE